MLDFFRSMMDDAPVCTMIPLAKSEDAPDGWLILDGSGWNPGDYPDFCLILDQKLTDDKIRAWWEEWGGETDASGMAVFPDVPSDEVYAASFGISPGKEELKLAIKVKNG